MRDFCENQTEINTGVHDSPHGAVDELEHHTARVQRELLRKELGEFLWPF